MKEASRKPPSSVPKRNARDAFIFGTEDGGFRPKMTFIKGIKGHQSKSGTIVWPSVASNQMR
jgi:hypothetical protein